MKTVIFSHGKETGPVGTKIIVMQKVAEQLGFETYSLDYRNCADATARVTLLKEFLKNKNSEKTVLVGSSMGGYVATAVSTFYETLGLFLLCPALYIEQNEYEIQTYKPYCKNIEIIHGWDDEVISYENSIRFGKETGAVLNLVSDNHRLSNSLPFLENRFETFLKDLEKTLR